MLIDHTSLPVRAYAAQKAFYTTLLAPLGYAMVMEFGEACGFAKAGGHSDFWLTGPAKGKENQEGNLNVAHIAFVGESKEVVQKWHGEALKAGAKDNGAPGPREHYGAGYYAAFVLDVEGNNIEVVYRGA